MTKDDYISWRNDPRTEEYTESILTEMDNIISTLILSAGKDSGMDRYRAGAIQGLKYLIEWQPFFENDTEETE